MSDPSPNFGLDALLCFNVYALNLAFSRFYQQAFGQTGFTYPKYLVLKALEESGPMSLSDLAARIGTEANTLSPLAKKMGQFGLLERVRDPEDERRVLISLKPFGRLVVTEASAVMADNWAKIALPEVQIEQANQVLTDMRTRLEKATPARTLQVPKRPED